ncbi:MAG TPA: nucleotide exchange factor GrpE [Chloroflexota bacterium]|nr:nucleotide exchange factor GrpE [Chloroflexota bacterium]
MNVLRHLFSFHAPATPTIPSPPPPLLVEAAADHGRFEENLAGLRREMEATGAQHQERLSEIAARLERIAGEVSKLGREQFRATTLLEGQGTSLDELADAWNAQLQQRERESADLGQALAALEGKARLSMVYELLPVVDALAESIRSARELSMAVQPSLPARPRFVLPFLGRRRAGPAVPPPSTVRSAALESWLAGLLLVERRLLALLEKEGVRPILSVGQPFDPRCHRAVAIADDRGQPAGTVVGEELRGYTVDGRVLRPAEVVVTRREDYEEDRRN